MLKNVLNFNCVICDGFGWNRKLTVRAEDVVLGQILYFLSALFGYNSDKNWLYAGSNGSPWKIPKKSMIAWTDSFITTIEHLKICLRGKLYTCSYIGCHYKLIFSLCQDSLLKC